MIFVDTSAWLALADSHDKDHARTLEFSRLIAKGEFGRQVTTNYVLTETVTMLGRRLGVEKAVAIGEGIERSEEVSLFWIESVHHREAMTLIAAHPDKRWSVTDCTSFVVMRALEIDSAFTLDRDFAQAGFTVRP